MTPSLSAILCSALLLAPSVVAGQSADGAVTDAATFAALRGDVAPQVGQFTVNCTIKPLQSVEVSVALPGVVEEVYVRPGMQVEVGDRLLQLDGTLLKSELALAEAREAGTALLQAATTRRDGLAQKEARLGRARARKAVSIAEHEAAVLELAMAQSDIIREREALELAKLEAARVRTTVAALLLTSPVSGVVGEDLINPGEAAGGEHVATIYVNQPLRVEAFVPSALFGDFIGQADFSIVVNGDQEQPRPVVFDYAAQLADLASNTISVFFRLNAPNVLPGSKCVMNSAGQIAIKRENSGG